jgi:hypothetical protein
VTGSPGTAKSALVRAIAQAFGGSYFERLLTKFSTPEELFGPISLKALEQDRYERVTAGKLPEAEFAFVDEVFKANSAILNSLLTAMNERLFHNDGAPAQMPLVSLFGASNELPEGKELEALFDRFRDRTTFTIPMSRVRDRPVPVAPAAREGGCRGGRPRRVQARVHRRERSDLARGAEMDARRRGVRHAFARSARRVDAGSPRVAPDRALTGG